MKNRLRKNKKGDLPSMATMITIMFFFSILVIIGFKVMNELNEQFQNADVLPNAQARAGSQKLTNTFPGIIDNSFLFVTIGIFAGILILSALTRLHPIFYPFFIFGVFVLVLVSAALSNLYTTIHYHPTMIDVGQQLTFIGYIMEFLPFIIALMGFIIAPILYKTWSAQQ